MTRGNPSPNQDGLRSLWRMTRTDAGRVAWAVFLGCTTPCRLAREWEMPKGVAARLLAHAHRAGLIRRCSRGVYSSKIHTESA